MPTIITSAQNKAFKAQIRSTLDTGFSKIWEGSGKISEEETARKLILRHYGRPASETLRQVKDAAEIRSLIGDFAKDPKRKQVFAVWAFSFVPYRR